jgi:hypothetical protein
MTPAKPQQMSGHKDDPDDLIAELTKLMATETRNSPEKPVAAPPAPRSAPQTIRIPGMSQPVVATPAAPAAPERSPATGAGAAPATSWQDRLASKPAGDANPSSGAPAAGRQDATPSSGNWRPALAPDEAEPAHPTGPAFEFDFGFNQKRPEPARPVAALPAAGAAKPAAGHALAPGPASAPLPGVSPTGPAAPMPIAPPSAPARDPIAELIAAELSAGLAGRPAPASISAPEPVEAEPEADEVAPQPAPPNPPAPLQRPNLATVPAPSRPATLSLVPQSRSTAPIVRPDPESDRFITAPVFGLGNRPAGEAAPPKAELDPMDEIESLIGEAVRVELNAPPAQPRLQHEEATAARHASPPPQPVVPPLNTSFAPRRTSLREPEPEPVEDGADEAVLAAAAATGAEVGHVDVAFADEPPRKARQGRRQRQPSEARASGGAFRQLVVPAIAGTLLVAAGFGLYWGLGMSHNNGKAPILTADATPAKTIPPKPADTTPHSVVMDELSGTAATPAKETLVSRDQTAGADATQVASAAADDSDGGLANRKVRTVTVRPDGTIVASDDSVAGAAKLPVDRPNVPAVPGVAAANANAPATATAAAVSALAPSAPATGSPEPAATPAPAPVEPAPAPVEPATAEAPAPAAGDPNAPMPMPRSMRPASTAVASASPAPGSPVNAVIRDGQKPMDLIGSLATANDTPAAPASRPATPSAQVTAAADTGAMTPETFNPVAHVQLSSQRSQGDAQASANALQARFGKLFNGAKLSIVRVDLGARGIYYRVMMPTSSLGDAQHLCAQIKQTGGDCVAANG